MAKKLIANVPVTMPDGRMVMAERGTVPPPEIAAMITNPHVWEGGSSANDSTTAPEPEEVKDPEPEEPGSDGDVAAEDPAVDGTVGRADDDSEAPSAIGDAEIEDEPTEMPTEMVDDAPSEVSSDVDFGQLSVKDIRAALRQTAELADSIEAAELAREDGPRESVMKAIAKARS